MFWIDLEMTGLDEKVHHILEVAIVITSWDFKVLEEFHRVVYQPPAILGLMDDWCRKTHGDSGLTAQVQKGTPLAAVERDIMDIVHRHYKKDERVVLVGNSVGNDKRFLDYYMPQLAKRLHYRIVDVSSFKEVFRNRYSIEIEKKGSHRAIDDIKESIQELKHFLTFVQHPLNKAIL